MAEDTKGTTNPVTETQDAPMPSAEQKTTETTGTDQAVVPQGEAAPQKEEVGELPQEVSERTRREFDKLKEQLRQEREKRLRTEGVFKSIQPKEVEIEPVIDPYTGQVDERLTAIQKRALEAERRAIAAEQAIQSFTVHQQQQDDERDWQQALQSHPELASDKKLYSKVRAVLTDSMLNPDDYGGSQLTAKEAADFVKGVDTKEIEKAKKQAAAEALVELTPKEQASLEAVGSPNRAQDQSDLTDLQRRSRKGDIDAIAERLKRIPTVGKG